MQFGMNRRRVCALRWIAVLGCWFAWCLPAPGQTPSGSGTVLTIAGSGMSPGFAGDGGAAVNATLSGPEGLAIGRDGTIYFIDTSNFRVRQIKPGTGVISTVAGKGPPPGGVLLDGPNGDGGAAIGAQLDALESVAIDRQRNTLYLSSIDLSRVRQVNLTTGIISNFAGGGSTADPANRWGDNGPAAGAVFLGVDGVAVGTNHDVYITDSFRSRLHKVSDATGIISPLAGINDAFGNPKHTTAGNGGLANQASLGFVRRVTVDPLGNLFILDPGGGTNLAWTVRRIDATSRIIDKVAGGGTVTPGASGPATSFNFNGLGDLALDESGNLFISDQTQIFKVNLSTGQLAPYAGGATADFSGDGGPAANARFHEILGMTVAPGGGLFVSDTTNNRIRYIVPDSIRLIGSGQTELHLPWISSLSGDFIVTNNSQLAIVDAPNLKSVAGIVRLGGNAFSQGINLGITQAGSIDVTGNASTSTVDLASLTSVTGSINVNNNASASTVNLSSLIGAGGDVNVNANATASAVNLSSLASVGGSISVSNNASTSTVSLSSLTVVTGGVSVVGNTSATSVNLSSLASAGGDINVSANASTNTVDLGSLTTAGGAVVIVGNGTASTINLGSLTTAIGSLSITNNTSATNVIIGPLASVGGNVNISGNGPGFSLNLGSLTTVGGSVTITDNGAAPTPQAVPSASIATSRTIDLHGLRSVGGDLTVGRNGTAASVLLGSLASVRGNLTVETTSPAVGGTLNIGGASVRGDTSLVARGYSTVSAATAAGKTALTMVNGAATMELRLPMGSFASPDPTRFSVQSLAGGAVESLGATTIHVLAGDHFTFATPTLTSPAALNFELDLSALDSTARSALLALLHDRAALTLAVRGDFPGDPLRLFDATGPEAAPMLDQSVRVLWLDASRAVLNSSGGIDPSIIRFESQVSHFSTYEVVAVSVPEPAVGGLLLLLLGATGLRGFRRR